MPVKNKILFAVFLTLLSVSSFAQNYSYVYIQGDKDIPFYVKLEGEMLPRYGKNYCIIPRLEEGFIHIELMFQQHSYPAADFTIKVPANGFRGFLLTHKDSSFSLYDLHQNFYLPEDNTEDQDHAPDFSAASIVTPTNPGIPAETPNKGNTPNFINKLKLDHQADSTKH